MSWILRCLVQCGNRGITRRKGAMLGFTFSLEYTERTRIETGLYSNPKGVGSSKQANTRASYLVLTRHDNKNCVHHAWASAWYWPPSHRYLSKTHWAAIQCSFVPLPTFRGVGRAPLSASLFPKHWIEVLTFHYSSCPYNHFSSDTPSLQGIRMHQDAAQQLWKLGELSRSPPSTAEDKGCRRPNDGHHATENGYNRWRILWLFNNKYYQRACFHLVEC